MEIARVFMLLVSWSGVLSLHAYKPHNKGGLGRLMSLWGLVFFVGQIACRTVPIQRRQLGAGYAPGGCFASKLVSLLLQERRSIHRSFHRLKCRYPGRSLVCVHTAHMWLQETVLLLEELLLYKGDRHNLASF